jgi:hypothetical protein
MGKHKPLKITANFHGFLGVMTAAVKSVAVLGISSP